MNRRNAVKNDLPPGFVEAFQEMRRQPPITFAMKPDQAWYVVALLQLACRHPEVNANMRQAARRFGDQLAGAIENEQARAFLEMGWDPANDVPRRDNE